jgi:hypothetical protein
MRSLVSFVALFAAISGLIVVIAYGASESYLTLRDQDEDLNSALMLGSLAPSGWTANAASLAGFGDRFLSPCLGVPLLRSVGTDGRGAMRFSPDPAQTTNVQMLVVQTSESSARDIMSSVQRDTENNCERGRTIGTVQEAEVTNLDEINGAEGFLVTYRQPNDSAGEHHIDAIVREGAYVGLLTFRGAAEGGIQAAQLLEFTSALSARASSPPSLAEIEAAGLLREPGRIERAAERLNAESKRLLTLDGKISLYVGLAALGAISALLYVMGARLGRTPVTPLPQTPIFGNDPPPPVEPLPSRPKQPQRRWLRQSLVKPGPSVAVSIEPEFNGGTREFESPAEPVLNFPQRSLDDKLRTLKEARLNDTRREPATPLPVMPDVDWTEEISKPARRSAPRPADPAPQPVSRKALLQKLRSQPPK